MLGGLLLDNSDQVGDIITDADSTAKRTGLVYSHIVRLVGDSKPADVVTVSESLASAQKLDYVGGLAYLGALVENVPTAANIRHYAQIVRDRSILRQLAGKFRGHGGMVYVPQGRGAKEVLDQAESEDPAHCGAGRARDAERDRHAAGRTHRDAVQPRRSSQCSRRGDRSEREHQACSPATS